MRCPSVQCSIVRRTPNSFAMRITVRMSSVRCACAFSGISPRTTGRIASSFISKAGRFDSSSPAASIFFSYSNALKSVSRSFAATVMRAEMPFDA